MMTPIRAVGVIVQSPKLMMWSALPMAILIIVLSLVIYAILAGLGTWLTAAFTGFFASYAGVAATIVQILVAITLLYLSVFSLTILVSLFASPFNDLLAEATERELGVPGVPGASASRLIRVFFLDLRKTALTLTLSIAIGLFMLIPVVGLIGLLATALINTFTFVTYPQSRRETGVRDSIAWVRANLPASLGFGLTLVVLFSVPVINLFSIPLAVVGGTLLFVEREQA